MVKGWREPWRLYSKGLRMANMDLSTKDKVVSWALLGTALLLSHLLIHLFVF